MNTIFPVLLLMVSLALLGICFGGSENGASRCEKAPAPSASKIHRFSHLELFANLRESLGFEIKV